MGREVLLAEPSPNRNIDDLLSRPVVLQYKVRGTIN